MIYIVSDNDVSGNTTFCSSEESASKTDANGINISPNLLKSSDGTIRWIYELSLWKNPTIILTVWKVLLISSIFVSLLVFFVTLSEGLFEAVKISFPVFLISISIVTGLMLIVYPVFCIINGGKYCVLFEMNNKGVKHTQLDRQFNKAKAIGLLTVFVGGVTGNLSSAGAGLLSASRQSMYTPFKEVSRISVKKRWNVIYIGTRLEHNQVYTATEDFQFIYEYIREHCNINVKSK